MPKWVIEYYKNKNTNYFITNNFIIFPVEQFSNYFDITATYRVKRSGSGSVGVANMQSVINYFESNYSDGSYYKNNSKLFVQSKSIEDNTRFVLGKYEYMFSHRDDQFEIRKLSNTFNANVIFSISLKSDQEKKRLNGI